MRCNVVIIKYGRNKFIFIENEPASNAFNFNKSVYKNCSYVSIQNSISATQIKPADKLQISGKYSVKVFYDISFKCIDKPHFMYFLKMDFLSNVSDAQKMLVNKIDNLHLKQEDIIIFDEKKRKIDDNKKLLKYIQNFSHFFYYDLHYRIKNSNQKILNRPIVHLEIKKNCITAKMILI